MIVNVATRTCRSASTKAFRPKDLVCSEACPATDAEAVLWPRAAPASVRVGTLQPASGPELVRRVLRMERRVTVYQPEAIPTRGRHHLLPDQSPAAVLPRRSRVLLAPAVVCVVSFLGAKAHGCATATCSSPGPATAPPSRPTSSKNARTPPTWPCSCAEPSCRDTI
jgi:hypothetical protein